ncbi:G patch domain-containing protein 11 isoform X1 [Canna indica]|uniref:G patch domain-containing protein 11 isoform X1 n=1 Tax=Canna indica TaxID=4628 RepID=A0AAQ3QID7_9LILI|nr:G patch domain-containing protein 11 isoform X1 [Canna indica]
MSMAGRDGDDDDDDYMGDLSLFLPPDHDAGPKKKLGAKVKQDPPAPKPKPKWPRGLSRQEQRRLERERKQREEDERTRASLDAAIPDSNVGFRMLKMMGYRPGSALGKDGGGLAEPVGLQIRRSRAGIGVEEDATRKERAEVERKRRREEDILVEFGSRQKSQWRSRRIVGDYRKAEAALAQLEKREVVEPPEDDADEEKPEDEEEEEVITEENLHDILIKLRDEHQYCLYCGFQYESAEALANNCPGPSEEDH